MWKGCMTRNIMIPQATLLDSFPCTLHSGHRRSHRTPSEVMLLRSQAISKKSGNSIMLELLLRWVHIDTVEVLLWTSRRMTLFHAT